MTIPEGWVLAPWEPTADQKRALLKWRGYDPDAKEETLDALGQIDIATMVVFLEAYQVMLASAPPAPGMDDETIHQGRELNRLLAAGASPAPGGGEEKCIECGEPIAVKGQGWAKTVRAKHDSGDINEAARRLALCGLLDLADVCAGAMTTAHSTWRWRRR